MILPAKQKDTIKDKLFNLGRKLKRAVFYAGLSKNAYRYIKDGAKSGSPWAFSLKDKNDKRTFINLAFDLELGLSGKFWRGDLDGALSDARLAFSNLGPVCGLLNDFGIQYNVEICAGLLDPDFYRFPYLSPEQSDCIRLNRDLFSLSDDFLRLLRSSNVEIGVHSYSHRDFQKLSSAEIEDEIQKSVNLCESLLGGKVIFTVFPDNVFRSDAHFNLSLCYRAGDNLSPPSLEKIPNGLYWHPLSASRKDLKKILDFLARGGRSSFLHLWQHFAELKAGEVEEYLKIIIGPNRQIISVKNFLSLLEAGEPN